MIDTMTDPRFAAVVEYFRRVDAGDPSVVDLMTDEVQVYFPKFGTRRGKSAVGELAQGIMRSVSSIAHDFERMTILAAGHHVIVEGFESGLAKDGTPWPDPMFSEGRFCNVFEFQGPLIKRLHIYVDPDFSSRDKGRFLWGGNVRLAAPGTSGALDAGS